MLALTHRDRPLLPWAIACLAICAAAAVLSSCATIPDPTPTVGMTPIQYQDAWIATYEQRERQSILRHRIAAWGCTALDIATTFLVVNKGGKELNPVLPDPATKPVAFVGVKLSMGWWADWSIRKGWRREARIYSGLMCGAGLWNLSQLK